MRQSGCTLLLSCICFKESIFELLGLSPLIVIVCNMSESIPRSCRALNLQVKDRWGARGCRFSEEQCEVVIVACGGVLAYAGNSDACNRDLLPPVFKSQLCQLM